MIDSHLDRGRELRLEGRLEQALECFEAAVRLDGRSARAHAGRGATLAKMRQYARAIEAYWDSLRLQPVNAKLYAALADLYLREGNPEAAVDCLRQAVAQNPDDEISYSNFLYILNFDTRVSPEEVFREHRAYGERYAAAPVPRRPARRRRRRLRIGYASGDFCDNVINYFFEAPLFHHRRDAFEITLYSTTVHMDSVTDRLRKRACRWRDVRFASDEQVARLVQRDGIDILVDLSGHTSMARPGLFALKPAPVQVTWLGYPNTTGLTAIDYRITDACADPPGSTERWHTEELVRLPHGFLCYRPRRSAPQVAEAPCLRTGTVTFGSCSKPLKWNCDVIRTWAAILRRVSGSRLLLHHSTEGGGAARVSEAFLALGVTPDRIEFTPGLDWRDHFQWFHRVDLALDPFPYNGTTASCETLWMGVPMIVLAGRSHVSRVGTSLLTRIGLERLIARSPEEYVDLAVRLAADCAGLAGLRAGMRERMRRSPLLDGPGFTSDLEDAYLAMWKRFRVGHGRAALSQNP